MKTPEHAFRDRLKRAVEACSLEKQEIAKRAGLRRPGTLSTWLGDGPDFAIPRGQQLLRLPGILGVSGHWLLTGEGSMQLPDGTEPLRLEVIGKIADGQIDAPALRRLLHAKPEDGTTRTLEDVAEILGENDQEETG